MSILGLLAYILIGIVVTGLIVTFAPMAATHGWIARDMVDMWQECFSFLIGATWPVGVPAAIVIYCLIVFFFQPLKAYGQKLEEKAEHREADKEALNEFKKRMGDL